MDTATPQWKRIKEIERASVLFWNFAIGVSLTAGTALMMRHEVANAPPGFLGLASALHSSIGPLLFFFAGLAFIGGSAYTLFEKRRNKVWLDVEFPLASGGKLRARVGSDRPLVNLSGAELEATLSCKRRESEHYTDNDGKQQLRMVDTQVWGTQQRFPLVAGLASCEFELDIPAEAPPGSPGAEGIYSARPGIFWNLAVYFSRDKAFVNRSYRLLVAGRAA